MILIFLMFYNGCELTIRPVSKKWLMVICALKISSWQPHNMATDNFTRRHKSCSPQEIMLLSCPLLLRGTVVIWRGISGKEIWSPFQYKISVLSLHKFRFRISDMVSCEFITILYHQHIHSYYTDKTILWTSYIYVEKRRTLTWNVTLCVIHYKLTFRGKCFTLGIHAHFAIIAKYCTITAACGAIFRSNLGLAAMNINIWKSLYGYEYRENGNFSLDTAKLTLLI